MGKIGSKSIGAFVKKRRNQYSNDTWVVFSKDSNDRPIKPRMYHGSLSRDSVRSIYSTETGTDFADTRSRRIVRF